MEQHDQQKHQAGKQAESGHDAGHAGAGGHGGMAQRGVTRPMGEHAGDGEHAGHHEMTEAQRLEMLHMHHMQTLWVYWTIILLGILVIPLGLVHIFLVISQPVVVGYWCTFCLLAAAIMLPMIPLEVDEVIAMGQHLVASKRRGESLWRVFWKGSSPQGSLPDERSPELMELPEHFGKVFKASIWGMSFPWTLVVSAVLGVWLMAAPGVFGMTQWAAHIHHLGGALIVVVTVVAMGEVLRLGRYLNVLLGLMVALLPWFLDGSTLPGQVSGLLVGLVTAGLALPRGAKTEQYGRWDKYVV